MDKNLEWYQDFYTQHQQRPGHGYMLNPASWQAQQQVLARAAEKLNNLAALTDARLTLARLDARKPPPAAPRR